MRQNVAGTEQPGIVTFTMSQTANRPFFSADVLVIVALIIGAALFVSRALVAAIHRLLF